ncbi:MAG: DUF2189 domain-containing protein [Aquabacterium sp.]|uniref:DUF2189 domain-containing protein n=1 Tax=Aquabacterium sp. TaxID=1872578 RepID=UPI0025BE6C99|nr:DUF2189 domain-containing protein [Aquabacterium sp.]MBI5924407.1 DUF2189 domain-containing protein [Aquabacterium sp.]
MSDILPAQDRPLRVRKVHSLRTFIWLARGWSDFMDAPLVGLTHGVLMGAFGGLMLMLAWDRFWILAGAMSGFLMVAPILSTGLYAVSRALLRGESAGFEAVWAVWSSMDRRLVKFGILLTALGTGWVMTSAALITLGVKPAVTTPTDFLLRVVMAPNPGFFEIWLLVGGVMAAPVFASSVVAIPLLVDRKVSVPRAVLTSWRAVMANPICMSTWAAIVMSLSLLGLCTMMFGLILVIPVLGHATWHAYRDLVVRETGGEAV